MHREPALACWIAFVGLTVFALADIPQNDQQTFTRQSLGNGFVVLSDGQVINDVSSVVAYKDEIYYTAKQKRTKAPAEQVKSVETAAGTWTYEKTKYAFVFAASKVALQDRYERALRSPEAVAAANRMRKKLEAEELERKARQAEELARKQQAGALPAGLQVAGANDSQAVGRELARLLSFPVFRAPGQPSITPTAPLYLPAREVSLFDNANVLLQAGVLLAERHHGLTMAADAELVELARAASAVFRNRVRISEANEQYGQTATNSVQRMQELMVSGMSWSMLRAADRGNLEQRLNARFPGVDFTVVDAPWSAATQQQFEDMRRRLTDMLNNSKRNEFSMLARYADFHQADKAVALWQKHLLPAIRRDAAPVRAGVLDVQPSWMSVPASINPAKRIGWLEHIEIRNRSDKNLRDAVLEVRLANKQGDKETAYYYLEVLKAKGKLYVGLHPRWKYRRTEHSTETTAEYALWSPEHSEAGGQVVMVNPNPSPKIDEIRTRMLASDERYQAPAIALTQLLPLSFPGPIYAPAQRQELLAAAAPGSTYIYRRSQRNAQAKDVCIHFGNPNGQGGVDVKVFYLENGDPIAEGVPINWQARLQDDRRLGPVIRLGKTSWAFRMVPDFGPVLDVPVTLVRKESYPLLSVGVLRNR